MVKSAFFMNQKNLMHTQRRKQCERELTESSCVLLHRIILVQSERTFAYLRMRQLTCYAFVKRRHKRKQLFRNS
jgi:hypothetical protein